MAWLLGALLVLQLAVPLLGCAHRVAAAPEARLSALARIVGHAVETCHHDDDGQLPVGDAGPCCPCALCHAMATACPAAPASYTLALIRPATVGGVVSFPQPPPRASAVLAGFAGPRGPPRLG